MTALLTRWIVSLGLAAAAMAQSPAPTPTVVRVPNSTLHVSLTVPDYRADDALRVAAGEHVIAAAALLSTGSNLVITA
jgi:hypothetical protein